jgi:DNA-binding transcriptional regulator PaaX
MHVEGRIVSLTVRPDSIEDGVLLLMYGQKMLRANDAVTGSELMSGLTHTGQRVTRVDKTLVKASDKGDVIVLGAGRAKRYRLTNAGLAKAKDLAASQIARVA